MAEKNPLFIGLTRPAKFMGLPVGYFTGLALGAVLPFLVFDTSWFLVLSIIGYPPLYYVADRNPNLFEVFVVAISKTPRTPNHARHEGHVYVS